MALKTIQAYCLVVREVRSLKLAGLAPSGASRENVSSLFCFWRPLTSLGWSPFLRVHHWTPALSFCPRGSNSCSWRAQVLLAGAGRPGPPAHDHRQCPHCGGLFTPTPLHPEEATAGAELRLGSRPSRAFPPTLKHSAVAPLHLGPFQ